MQVKQPVLNLCYTCGLCGVVISMDYRNASSVQKTKRMASGWGYIEDYGNLCPGCLDRYRKHDKQKARRCSVSGLSEKEKRDILLWFIRTHLEPGEIPDPLPQSRRELEQLIRSSHDLVGNRDGCRECMSQKSDYSRRCASCIHSHWDPEVQAVKEQYLFRYKYWYKFYKIDEEQQEKEIQTEKGEKKK